MALSCSLDPTAAIATVGLALLPSLALEATAATADQELPQHMRMEAPATPPPIMHIQLPPVLLTCHGVPVN